MGSQKGVNGCEGVPYIYIADISQIYRRSVSSRQIVHESEEGVCMDHEKCFSRGIFSNRTSSSPSNTLSLCAMPTPSIRESVAGVTGRLAAKPPLDEVAVIVEMICWFCG